MSSGGDFELGGRLVELYDSLIELDVAVFVRQATGWSVLSAGEITQGRWWAEYERLGGRSSVRTEETPPRPE